MDKRGKSSLALLGAMLMAESLARGERPMEIALTRDPEPDLSPLLAMDRSSYWPSGTKSAPMGQLSAKERARRKKRREMAYESRRRNRRKK